MNIAQALQQHAQQHPRRIAMIERRGRHHLEISYSEFEEQSGRMAALLLKKGLKKGDKVMIFLPMSLQLYITLYACFRLGLLACMVDPRLTREQLAECCQQLQPKALIDPKRARRLHQLSRLISKIPIKLHPRGLVWGSTRLKAADKLTPTPIIVETEDEPALVTFNFDNNGEPKLNHHSHRVLQAQHRSLNQALDYHAGDIDFTTLPLFVLANLSAGLTSLIPDAELSDPTQVDAPRLCQQLLKYQPQRLSLSPTILQRIVDCCIQQQLQLSFPLHLYIAGGPVFPALLQRVHAIANKVQVTTVYGTHEAEPIAHIDYHGISQEELDAMTQGKGLLVGMPEPALRLHIVNDEQDPCQPGQILVSGEYVLAKPTKTQDEHPWHRTGDCGYLDEAGRLWVVGRCQQQLLDRHGPLYPFSVECAAMSHPPVERAAMLGYEGKRYLLIQAPTMGQADIQALHKALAWAHLEQIRKLEQIPLDPHHLSRVNYPELRARLQKILR